MFLSVIIPVYNEEKVISSTLQRIISYLKKRDFDWEIICVDDGSSDNSQPLIKNFSPVKILANNKNLGKGAAVKLGILAASGEWLLFLDADLSTDISELKKFEPYLSDYDIIIGSRQLPQTKIIKSQPFYRVLLGRLGNLIIRGILGINFKDTQCGFKIFNKKCQSIFRGQILSGWGFDFEILYLAQKFGFRIKEIGVNWHYSLESKVRFRSYWQTLRELLKIKFNILRKKYEKIHPR